MKAPRAENKLNQSSYYNSLVDPFANHGAKIPDAACYPSSTFAISFKLNLAASLDTSGTTHFTGFMLDSWRPSSTLVEITSFDASTGAITYGLYPTGAPSTLPGECAEWPQVKQIYQRIRPVSAGIVLDPSMSSLSDQGTLIGVNIPTNSFSIGAPRYSAATDPQYTNFTTLQNTFNSLRTPIKEGGMCVCYKPADETAFAYMTTDIVPSSALSYYGGAVIFCTGLAAGATLQMTVTINFEGVPRYSSLSLVSPTPSLRDGVELDHAINQLQTRPDVEAGPLATNKAKSVGKTGLTHHEPKQNGKSFATRLFDSVGSVASRVLPLLASFL
jgi:hypothetical protein